MIIYGKKRYEIISSDSDLLNGKSFVATDKRKFQLGVDIMQGRILKAVIPAGGMIKSTNESYTIHEESFAKKTEVYIALDERLYTIEFSEGAVVEMQGESYDSSGGGSAEIPTCTMKFKNGSDVQHNGSYSYTKYENGVMSLVSVETYEYLSEFDITLENVVCDSIVIFGWMYMGDWGNIAVDGNAKLLSDGMGSPNETSIFGSPTAAGEVCTIELQSGSDFGDEW